MAKWEVRVAVQLSIDWSSTAPNGSVTEGRTFRPLSQMKSNNSHIGPSGHFASGRLKIPSKLTVRKTGVVAEKLLLAVRAAIIIDWNEHFALKTMRR